MTSSADDLVRKAVDLRECGRIDEAIIAARRAASVDPDNANTWWQLGLAVAAKNGETAAIPHFKKTVTLAESFAFGWHRLGTAYQKSAMPDQAIECWETAIEHDADRVDSLKALADAYKASKLDTDAEKLFEVLETLDMKGELNTSDLNTLGIAYHNRKDYHKAIQCYQRYAVSDKTPIGYFNLGLALSAPEVSQDADAVDAWRRALARSPGYDNAQNSLKAILPRLLELRKRIQTKGEKLIGQDQWYHHYINPFELLNLTDDPFELDSKAIKRAKDTLRSEIKLEDGLVQWMPGLRIDESRAIKVTDQLADENVRQWHYFIYINEPLLEFLSRGKIDHFLVDEYESPLDILDSMTYFPDEFESIIGESFAAQFNLLLTKAIEKGDADIVEAMLDGRRWVLPTQEDQCYEGAIRKIDDLIKPLRQILENSEKVKPSVITIRTVLATGNIGRIIGMLPISLQAIQLEASKLIRSISIAAYNHHKDAHLAKDILSLCKLLAGRSSSVLLQMEEDSIILDKRIESERREQEYERLDSLLEPLRKAAKSAKKVKPSVESVRAMLANGNLGTVIGSLPSHFQELQDEATMLVRGISVDTYNHHSDVDLAKNILTLSKVLAGRSSSLLVLIDNDMKTLDERIKEECKDEAFMNDQGVNYCITRKSVIFGNRSLSVQDVRSLRWGITVSRNGSTVSHAYTFAVGGKGSNVMTLGWSAHTNLKVQDELFNKFVNASFVYLMPRVIAMLKKDLDNHLTIRIGTALVSQSGITFTIEGWFSSKQEICSWNRLQSEIQNGEVIMTDKFNSKCKISLPLATVDNAIALHLMINNPP